MFDLASYLFQKRAIVDERLEELLSVDNSTPPRIVLAMRHSLFAGGKRLRPILCIAAAEAVGGEMPLVLPAACAIEMIHTYSLIHDDLPAMDDDRIRRGKPTCHIAYDEATAILAGDALLTLSFETMADAALSFPARSIDWLRVIKNIAVASGYCGMVEGQMRDIESEDTLLSSEQLESVHRLKTGALIRASVSAGGILSGADARQIDHLDAYASCVGLAFQVTDDILNVEGDPTVMGKAAGSDADMKKCTYPSLLGLEKSRTFARELIDNALHSLDLFDNNANPLRAIAAYVLERKK